MLWRGTNEKSIKIAARAILMVSSTFSLRCEGHLLRVQHSNDSSANCIIAFWLEEHVCSSWQGMSMVCLCPSQAVYVSPTLFIYSSSSLLNTNEETSLLCHLILWDHKNKDIPVWGDMLHYRGTSGDNESKHNLQDCVAFRNVKALAVCISNTNRSVTNWGLYKRKQMDWLWTNMSRTHPHTLSSLLCWQLKISPGTKAAAEHRFKWKFVWLEKSIFFTSALPVNSGMSLCTVCDDDGRHTRFTQGPNSLCWGNAFSYSSEVKSNLQIFKSILWHLSACGGMLNIQILLGSMMWWRNLHGPQQAAPQAMSKDLGLRLPGRHGRLDLSAALLKHSLVVMSAQTSNNTVHGCIAQFGGRCPELQMRQHMHTYKQAPESRNKYWL